MESCYKGFSGSRVQTIGSYLLFTGCHDRATISISSYLLRMHKPISDAIDIYILYAEA